MKFIISLQWRTLVTDETLKTDTGLIIFQKQILEAEKSWKDYLLGLRSDSGVSRHYVLFLQNLASAEGELPEDVNPRVNTYLIRSVDATCAISKTKVFLYTKMGPVVVVSGVVPKILKDMSDSQVRMRGSLKVAQNLGNKLVNEFVFVTRPNEAMNLIQMSEKQQTKIEKDFLKNVPNKRGVNAVLVGYSDYLMGQGKRIRRT